MDEQVYVLIEAVHLKRVFAEKARMKGRIAALEEALRALVAATDVRYGNEWAREYCPACNSMAQYFRDPVEHEPDCARVAAVGVLDGE